MEKSASNTADLDCAATQNTDCSFNQAATHHSQTVIKTSRKIENMGILAKIAILLFFLLFFSPKIFVSAENKYNPCCSFPCKNRGVCVTKGFDDYTCDCTGLDYYGRNCGRSSIWKKVKTFLKPHPATINNIATKYGFFWGIINHIPYLHNKLLRYFYISRSALVDTTPRYTSIHEYITSDSYFNRSLYARTLPPVPLNCPTPMGVAGNKELPSIDLIMEKLFRRRKFIPDPHGSNMLFSFFAQHFTHQFFKTDHTKSGPGFTWGEDGVDVSNVYGKDATIHHLLRSFKNGKLKTHQIDGEDFPPLMSEVPKLEMKPIPPGFQHDGSPQFALPHPLFNLNPGLLVMVTMFQREHNRVCDILQKIHPDWDDEQLFQTARLIIMGQTIKIVFEDYIQHLSQYKLKTAFKPQLLHNVKYQYTNKIRFEFNILYHWHPLVSDSVTINGTEWPMRRLLYSTEALFKYGLDRFVDALARERAGALTNRNNGPEVMVVLRQTLEQSRQVRLQSYNNYRKRFDLPAVKTFKQLTADKEIASVMQELYGHVDAVEFYPGLFAEKMGPSLTPLTIVTIGGPYSVKGLLSNPICSPDWWKPSTFGGETGFNLVKKASLKRLFCLNMKSRCEGIHVSLTVPEKHGVKRFPKFEDTLKIKL